MNYIGRQELKELKTLVSAYSIEGCEMVVCKKLSMQSTINKIS